MFKCKHPFKFLRVERQHSEAQVDTDFIDVTYHLYCVKCSEALPMTHARLVGGVDGFIRRGRGAETNDPTP